MDKQVSDGNEEDTAKTLAFSGKKNLLHDFR